MIFTGKNRRTEGVPGLEEHRERHFFKGNGIGEMKKNLFVLVLAAAVVLMMTACGSQKDSGSGSSRSTADSQNSVSVEPQILSPGETAEKFMQTIKDQDEDSMAEVYGGDPDDVFFALNYEELNDALDDDSLDEFDQKAHAFEYTVENEKQNGNAASVDVTIRTCDFGTLIGEFLEEYEVNALKTALAGKDDDPITEAALEKFETGLDKLEQNSESKVTLTLTQTDGKWVVDDVKKDARFMDALSGGSYSAFINANKELRELMEEAEEEDDGEI